MDQAELPAASTGASYLVQGSILEGTKVCSVIKSHL